MTIRYKHVYVYVYVRVLGAVYNTRVRMQRFRWKIVRNEISYAKQSECRGLHVCVRVCFNCQRESLRVNSKMETFIEGVGAGAGVRGASREKRFTGIAGNGKEAAASTHRCSTGLTRCTGDRRGGI